MVLFTCSKLCPRKGLVLYKVSPLKHPPPYTCSTTFWSSTENSILALLWVGSVCKCIWQGDLPTIEKVNYIR